MEKEKLLKVKYPTQENLEELINYLLKNGIVVGLYSPYFPTDDYVIRLNGIYYYDTLDNHFNDLCDLLKTILEQEEKQNQKKQRIRGLVVEYLKQFENETKYNFSLSIGEKR